MNWNTSYFMIMLPVMIVYAIIYVVKNSRNPNKKFIIIKKYDFSQKSEEERFVTESAFNDNLLKKMLVTPETIYQSGKIDTIEGNELSHEYFFYTNKAEKAEALTKEIEKLNYIVNRTFFDENKKVFVVSGWTTKMKITNEAVKIWANQMCELGYQFDCEFDVLETTPDQKEMESILIKYLNFSSGLGLDSNYVNKNAKLFNAISQHIKEGHLINVIKGERDYSTFRYVHPGSFAMPYEDTCIPSLFSIFYVLIDNGILKKEAITDSLIELSKKKDYLYIFSYLYHYLDDHWINTYEDIVLDWRSLVEFINKEYLEKGIEIIDDKFFYNEFMKRFNDKNCEVRFMI